MVSTCPDLQEEVEAASSYFSKEKIMEATGPALAKNNESHRSWFSEDTIEATSLDSAWKKRMEAMRSDFATKNESYESRFSQEKI